MKLGPTQIVLTLFLATLLAPFLSAEAQQPAKIPRIGFIAAVNKSIAASDEQALRNGLQELGYIDGKNISIEIRYAEGKSDRIPVLVKELVQQKVDIIVVGNGVGIVAAKQATKDIAIVMVSALDPVLAGYVDSLAHPGGNLTGLTTRKRELSSKRIELIKELFPNVSRIATLWESDFPGSIIASKEYQEAARGFKLQIQSLELRGASPDIEGLFRAARINRVDGLIVLQSPLTLENRSRIIELANKNRIVTMTEDSRFVDVGGLSSYSVNRAELFQHAATYVDKILKGAPPSDLPVEQPKKFELVINLKTAKQIGVTIPPSVLMWADRVIKERRQ